MDTCPRRIYPVTLFSCLILLCSWFLSPVSQCVFLSKGTVSVLLAHGMVVHLSDNIKGLVPRTHLSDIILKNPEKKYMEGMKIKCRVSPFLSFKTANKHEIWLVQLIKRFADFNNLGLDVFLQVLSVEPETKKLYLTRKKAMVESTLPLFRTFADARPGRVSHGYIVCVKDFGCIVRFYNDVKGLVPLGELSAEPISRPEDVFYVGQVSSGVILERLLTFDRVTGLV